jgi:general secretion pathway protein D
MRSANLRLLTVALCIFHFALLLGLSPVFGQGSAQRSAKVMLDFNEVDLPVFVRFMSELTGKHFVLDEKVTGKITVYSPTKVTVEQAYNMFLSALEVRRLAAVPKGDVIMIVQAAEVPPERGVHVYKLNHASATDTATVLTSLVARSLNPPPAPGGRPPLRPATEFEAPVQIFSDKATNSLIMTATKGDYERLLSVIRALDTRRRQVIVEAVIMEVSVERLRQLGSDPAEVAGVLKKGALQGIAGFNLAPEQLQSIAQAITGTTQGGVNVVNTVNVRAFLQLLMQLTDANIISTPQILAADNQKAKIVVGQNVPIPTGQAQGITGGTLVTIERKDVGVTLEITPQVLEKDLVRLEVKQEITAIATGVSQVLGTSATTSIPVGPTFTKRAMENVTIARDQQTIVIGGLVRDDITITENKIPWLGDIPWLGWLFRSQSKQTIKNNLLVFLTPHLIKDEVDMVKLNERKGQEVERIRAQGAITEPTAVKRAAEEQLLPAEQEGREPLNSGEKQ